MTTLALIGSSSLLGQEIKEALGRHKELWTDIRLLSSIEEELGVLTEVAGGAAFIRSLETDSLDGADLVLVCGPGAPEGGLPDGVPPTARVLVVSPDGPVEGGLPLVAGVNLDRAGEGRMLVSPHPAVIALAQLLHPLREHGLREAVAWLLQPASMRGQEGLDELLEQTRSILSFRSDPPRAVFGRQLAFNLFPAGAPTKPLADDLKRVLGRDFPIAIRVLQTGVFHSFGVSAFVVCDRDPGLGTVREALGEAPFVRLSDPAATLGPIDAAAREELLLGSVEADPDIPGGYWLWGVMDNLTRGGALNAVAVAEALFAPRH